MVQNILASFYVPQCIWENMRYLDFCKKYDMNAAIAWSHVLVSLWYIVTQQR